MLQVESSAAIDQPQPLRRALPAGPMAEPADLPGVGFASESCDRWRRMLTALRDLRDGYEFASTLGREIWDFAVEIDDLTKRGLRSNDLRWLIFKGWVAHAHEQTLLSTDRRCFIAGGPSRFDNSSCFVLTSAGAEALERRLGSLSEPLDAPSEPTLEVVVPRWDQQRQELRLAQFLIKRFKVPAHTQGTILCAFEEENWPPRIDDPLPGHPEQDRKRRLHNAINALNRNQIHPMVRFLGDGRGLGVRWELTVRSSG